MPGAVETEVKIRVPDAQTIAKKLEAMGLHVHVPRAFEANTLYDTEAELLRGAGRILRLREVAGRYVVTFKGPEENGRHKSREELETEISSADAVRAILERLGYKPVFRYEKYRTEYKYSEEDEGVVTVDQTPIGDFLELEGSSDWIDATAQRLGFGSADYVLESYGKLYIADCERRGVEPTNMVFSS